MSRLDRLLLVPALLLCSLSPAALAEAPVVDVSENFVMLDEGRAGLDDPSTATLFTEQGELSVLDNEPALATAMSDENNMENASLLGKFRELQQEVQELRGQLEVQAHDLNLLQQQQMAFYNDLDSRLRQKEQTVTHSAESIAPIKTAAQSRVEPGSPRSASFLPATTTTQGNPANEQISYLAAYELVKNKQYDQAITAMQHFVAQYPQGGYTANAYYWLGELFAVKKNYPQAIAHFETVLNQFPSSNKNSASLLKLAYALAATGKIQEAKTRLQEVMKNYPGTNTAHLAAAKLDELEGE